MNKTALQTKTKKELLEIAKRLKLSGLTSFNKPALVSLILDTQTKTVTTPEASPVVTNTTSSWSGHHASEQETIEDSKYYEGFIQQTFPEQKWTLPQNYGDTKAVLLIRDPFWFYAYWEVNEQSFQEVRQQLGHGLFEESQKTLRVYDVTDLIFNGQNAHKFFDISIGEADR